MPCQTGVRHMSDVSHGNGQPTDVRHESDMSVFVGKETAAQVLGVSTKQVERLVKRGELTPTKQQGRVVFDSHEVEELRQRRAPNPKVHTPSAPTMALAPLADGEHTRDLLDAFVQALTRASQHVERPLWLTVRQAAVAAGLPATDIRRAIDDGSLAARKTGRGLRVRRRDLEAL